MSNEVIGIAGVFIVTFFLMAFLHVFLRWGHPRRSPLRPPSPTTLESDTTDLKRDKADDDDSWLLRSTDGEIKPSDITRPGTEARPPDDFGGRARPPIHSVK